MTIPYLTLVVLSVCAVTYFRMGQLEKTSGVLWAVLSIAVSFVCLWLLHCGPGGLLLGQAALYVAITLYRMRK